MSNDVDFEQFIKLLDGALASDDPTIKESLRKFLFVAAMVLGDEAEPGPFTKMMETMDDMQRRLNELENKELTTTTPYQWPAPGSPYWGGGSAGGSFPITYTNGTGSINTGGTSTTTSAVSTVTVGGNSTTTGNITLNGGTSGYSFTPGTSSGTTTTTINYVPFPEESGTEIKQEIKDALDGLAKVA